MPMAAATPIAGAPRMTIVRTASATSSHCVQVTYSCPSGSLLWSIITPLPSSHSMVPTSPPFAELTRPPLPFPASIPQVSCCLLSQEVPPDSTSETECWIPNTTHRRVPVSYTHLRAHETKANLVCRLLLEKKKNKQKKKTKKQKNKNNKTKKQKTKKNK